MAGSSRLQSTVEHCWWSRQYTCPAGHGLVMMMVRVVETTCAGMAESKTVKVMVKVVPAGWEVLMPQGVMPTWGAGRGGGVIARCQA